MPNDDLPELTPEMLCSYGGMRELEGARATQPRGASAPTPSPEDAVFEDWAATAPLENIDNEISFDNDYNIDAELGSPRGGGGGYGQEVRSFRTPARQDRFNVLRPPVQRPPPPAMPSDYVGGPRPGMREVGRVGNFPILTPDEHTPPRDYLAEAHARLEDRAAEERQFVNPARSPRTSTRMTAAQVRQQRSDEFSARQAEQRAAVHETLPTAYDRLMGDDPFEDDLE